MKEELRQKTFTYDASPCHVVFGPESFDRLDAEVEALGLRRVLVLCTPGRVGLAERAAKILDARCVGVFRNATRHTPMSVTEDAVSKAIRDRADATVAIGGGSAIGLGKAIALRLDVPQIAVPTTYAGSEMTDILGQTVDGRKTTLRDESVRPRAVIYDPELTLALPTKVTVTSGFNAIAHAVEALYAPDRNPVVSLLAEEGMRSIGSAIPVLVENPKDPNARHDALYGAWLCGLCLGSVSMALHHKLCHILGGAFNLPHAETHAVLLPYVVDFNSSAAPEVVRRVGVALTGSVEDGSEALHKLARVVGAPTSLKTIGMPEEGIELAVRLLTEKPIWNPVPLNAASVEVLIRRAWDGGPRPVD